MRFIKLSSNSIDIITMTKQLNELKNGLSYVKYMHKPNENFGYSRIFFPYLIVFIKKDIF